MCNRSIILSVIDIIHHTLTVGRYSVLCNKTVLPTSSSTWILTVRIGAKNGCTMINLPGTMIIATHLLVISCDNIMLIITPALYTDHVI